MNPDPVTWQIVAAHFPGSTVRAMIALKGGVSAEVYRLDLEAPGSEQFSVALRIHGPTHNGHDAALEFALLRSLADSGIGAPKPITFDDSCEIANHPYLLLDHIAGETTIPPASVEACIATAADKLAAIHGVSTAALPRLPDRIDPLPELPGFLPPDARWAPLRSHFERRTATAFAGTPVLLHGDFWPGNWVWQGARLAGVLDWEDAAIGDPLSDVACACLELRYLYGIAGANLFAQSYARHHPLDPERLALWQAYVAAAGQYSMAQWGLGPAREARMRAIALQSIEEAAAVLI